MLFTVLLLQAAPQAEPKRPTVTVVADPATGLAKKICRREVPVGSMIPVKRCRTVGEAQQTERDTQTALDRVRAPNGALCKNNGC